MSLIEIQPSKVRYASQEEMLAENATNQFADVPLSEIERRVQNVIPQLKIRSDFLGALERNGASANDVARTIGEVLNEGQTHGIRLRAAEIAMRSMGLFDPQPQSLGSVTFQIHGENVNLQAVLQPNRERMEEKND